MSKKLRFDYPYIEDFGAQTRVLLNEDPEGRADWNAFNPSIGASPDGSHAVLLRTSNYYITELGVPNRQLSSIKNELWFSELDDELNLIDLRKISVVGSLELHQGVEDARLLWRDGAWYFTAVTYKEEARVARLHMFALFPEDNIARHLYELPSWEASRSEKNWMAPAIEKSPHFDFVYGPTGVYSNGRFIFRPVEDKYVDSIRGGSSLWDLQDGSYLSITHTVYYTEKVTEAIDGEGFYQTFIRNYTHQFARYDSYGKLLELSEEFVFDSPGIEFAAGLVEKDGNLLISYGREDSSANLATISKASVLSLLNPVGEIFE